MPLDLVKLTGRDRDHLVQKIQNLEDAKKMTWPRYLSQKMDGCYCMAIKHDDETFIYSRRGEIYSSMNHLQNQFQEILTEDKIVIFEAYVSGVGQNVVSGYCRDTQNQHGDIVAMCHQFLTLDELLEGGYRDYEWSLRWLIDNLLPYIDGTNIEVLNQYLVQDEHIAKEITKRIVHAGGEGTVLRDPHKAFQPGKRNSSVVRIKQKLTLDLMCVGTYDGTKQFEGMMGGIICRYKDGKTVRVGTGFKWKQGERDQSFRDYVVGKVVEIEAMRDSAKGILREPRFKYIREDKEEGEY